MALTVVLLRHAKAKRPDGLIEDFDRTLNKRGRAAAPLMGTQFRRLKIRVDAVLCSSAKRTRETLELFASAANLKAKPVFEDELYLADPDDLLDRLRALPKSVKSVLVVGHNPGIHQLAIELAGKGDTLPVHTLKERFPTGALAVIVLDAKSWADVEVQSGRLKELLFPKGFDVPEAD
jgi:phosphohistidine phosphatase